jgi:hypothetical protein
MDGTGAGNATRLFLGGVSFVSFEARSSDPPRQARGKPSETKQQHTNGVFAVFPVVSLAGRFPTAISTPAGVSSSSRTLVCMTRRSWVAMVCWRGINSGMGKARRLTAMVQSSGLWCENLALLLCVCSFLVMIAVKTDRVSRQARDKSPRKYFEERGRFLLRRKGIRSRVSRPCPVATQSRLGRARSCTTSTGAGTASSLIGGRTVRS